MNKKIKIKMNKKRLGNGNTKTIYNPTMLFINPNIKKIVAGKFFTIYYENESIYGFGNNSNGSLGLGHLYFLKNKFYFKNYNKSN